MDIFEVLADEFIALRYTLPDQVYSTLPLRFFDQKRKLIEQKSKRD